MQTDQTPATTWWYLLKYDTRHLPKAVEATQFGEQQLRLAVPLVDGTRIVGMHTNVWDYWPTRAAALAAQEHTLTIRLQFTTDQFALAQQRLLDWQRLVTEANRLMEDDCA